MNTVQDFLQSEKLALNYGPTEVIINLVLAFILGLTISYVYKTTHKGLSYSQSFMLTLVFVTIIVAMVMMVIGNSLARAFALAGALSIIRFRTVVKDTKDTAYVFLCLAGGMAAGTGSYFLGVAGVLFMSSIAYILSLTNYGSLYKSEFILRMRVLAGESDPEYSKILSEFSQSADLLHVEPSGDSSSSKLTFDVVMKKDRDPAELSHQISTLPGVSEVLIVASKNDVDY